LGDFKLVEIYVRGQRRRVVLEKGRSGQRDLVEVLRAVGLVNLHDEVLLRGRDDLVEPRLALEELAVLPPLRAPDRRLVLQASNDVENQVVCVIISR
jgi:hypothetical protein